MTAPTRRTAAASLPELERDNIGIVLLRRTLSIGLLGLATVSILASLPVWIPIAAAMDLLLPGQRSTVRCGVFLVHYVLCEWAGLAAAGLNVMLRVLLRDSGPRGEWRRLMRLQSVWASWLLHGARRIFDFEIDVSGRDAIEAGPMILMMRHASVADTVLAAVFVTAEFGRPLRYVMKRELLWDPCLDIVGNRLPNYFVRRGGGDSEREVEGIASLMDGLGADEGVMIYPEGTRFSDAKRARVLERIRAGMDPRLIARAEALRHTLPPRVNGALALLDKDPGLDVVIGMHTGFERAGTFWDLWNGAMRGTRVKLHFERFSHDELPTTRIERVDWLFERWSEIDDWIEASRDARADVID